nr:AMP-binding protein [Azonexus sp. R2A61]
MLVGGAGETWDVARVTAAVDVLGARLAGSRVLAVLADNSPAWVVADLAAQQAGVVHLPLPAFFSDAQMAHALSQSAADSLLTDQPERIGRLDLGFCLLGEWQGLTWMRRVTPAVELPPGTAKISFTSGSTGAPKGVCLSAEGLHDTALAVRDRLHDLPLTRHLCVLPLALLLENVAGVYAPLLRGMPVHLPPLAELGWAGRQGFDPAALNAAADRVQPASVILVPELLKAWTAFLRQSGGRPPASLVFAAVGGARVAAELLTQARAAGIPAYQGYGLTEAGSVTCLNRPGDDGDGVGRPLGHARVVADARELYVETRAFLGYAGQPAPPPAAFPTGDLGDIDNRGHVHLAGRRKNLLITSFGRNISPEWPEALLLGDPRILQAVVVGDGKPAPVALLVTMPGLATAQVDALLAAVNAQLPDYARLAGWQAVPPFTPVNGLATGNGRPVRERIIDHHAAAIAAIYANKETPHVLL